MATSGRVETGWIATYFGFYFQWQLSGQNTPGNYSTINWQWGVYIRSGGWLGTNAVKSVSGFINGSQVFGANTWSNISGNGDHQLLSGSFNVPHNSDGTKNFGISSTGWITGAGNYNNGGSWDLPTIPRQVNITGVSGTYNSDLVNALVSWSPNGNRVDLKLEAAGMNPFKRWNDIGGSSGNFTLNESERNALNAYIANANTTNLRWTIITVIGGVDTFFSFIDRTYQIVNANPTFTDFDYKDNDSAVAAITGDDQVLVQGESDLRATILSADKMVALKSATANRYTFNIDGKNSDEAYSSGDINEDIGAINNSGVKRLTVRAYDSRNNFTEVYKDITVIPYARPIVNATVLRENGFEEQTALNIAGSYSRVVVGGTPKNAVSDTTGVRYRYKEVGGSFGSWVNKSATVNTSTGEITTSETLINLDNNTEYIFEVEIIDLFGSTVVELALDRGKPILWLGANRTVGINHIPDDTTEGLHIQPGDALWDYIYPVGSVVLRTTNTNPQSVFGGTWVATTTASASILGETMYGFKRTA